MAMSGVDSEFMASVENSTANDKCRKSTVNSWQVSKVDSEFMANIEVDREFIASIES